MESKGLEFKKEIKIPVPWGHMSGNLNGIMVKENITFYVLFSIAKIWGTDDGDPVLALHGWQDNAGSFDTLAPLIPLNFQLVCLEFCGNKNFVRVEWFLKFEKKNPFKGHGLTSHYPPGMFFTYFDHVCHVKIVADYFKWTKFTIIGHRYNLKMLFRYC